MKVELSTEELKSIIEVSDDSTATTLLEHFCKLMYLHTYSHIVIIKALEEVKEHLNENSSN